MNARISPKLPLAEPVDLLLADVAVRIQLSPTHYNLAVSRYGTINDWIERDGSPLKDRVALFYPQGSMAIGATIASKVESDEFDIDLIAQLDLHPDSAPHDVLNLLEQAIRGDRGSRYYEQTERCTRCIQVQYADGMHLDVTPMIRLMGSPERAGYIFHSPEGRSTAEDKRIVANPYGFADWFEQQTPVEADFAKAFAEREIAYASTLLVEKADADPVPDQQPAHLKSRALIALQLLKRWRNLRYDGRNSRRPASVLLAKLVGDSANHTASLSEELEYQAQRMHAFFAEAEREQRLVHVENPSCRGDVFTDRWPSNLHEQRVFRLDLEDLLVKLARLRAGCSLSVMQEILVDLFGERPAVEAVRHLNESMGQAIVDGRSHHNASGGRFDLGTSGVLGSAGISAASSVPSVRATPKHTHYGE